MDKWNLVSISDCLSEDRINIGKIKTKEILVEGDFPVIDQSQNFISGYSNKTEYLYNGD